MKEKINIDLSKKQFARLQHTHTMYRSLLIQFKFQIPNYAKAQEKAIEMDKFLMELGMKFNEENETIMQKKKEQAIKKTTQMAEDIIEGMNNEKEYKDTSKIIE